ncbi:hypothetical protein ACFQI7_08700 [Paenibacillus allorhizosphaerae]|uniref:Helix-turn-helix domain-containing protein n=1 Tax=Paenibacillus allorhizosphaerae TaxID=2849866 RepID=A0ABM8VGT6_9BACL|nr:hypothetical protein [Paenibacillus allorhizosphaerae]CAG7639536.1 hypothetical protein PAECIP111802_02554 [Paenibacillus allorhizosphaerae]
MEENQNETILRLGNTLLNDDQISFRARGLFLYMIFSSRKKGFSIEMLSKASKTDSKRAIEMAINELETNGYLVKRQLKQGGIRWNCNLERNIKVEKRVPVTKTKEKQTTQAKKPQEKSRSRGRVTAKKTSAWRSFLKEFF